MREFQDALETCGQPVEVIKTRRIGYVVYEDEFQVARARSAIRRRSR